MNTIREAITKLERASTAAEASAALDSLLAAQVAALRSSPSLDGPHLCGRDQTITIRQYPHGGFVEVEVCGECRGMYADADLSEVIR